MESFEVGQVLSFDGEDYVVGAVVKLSGPTASWNVAWLDSATGGMPALLALSFGQLYEARTVEPAPDLPELALKRGERFVVNVRGQRYVGRQWMSARYEASTRDRPTVFDTGTMAILVKQSDTTEAADTEAEDANQADGVLVVYRSPRRSLAFTAARIDATRVQVYGQA